LVPYLRVPYAGQGTLRGGKGIENALATRLRLGNEGKTGKVGKDFEGIWMRW
jgi:hypothetical protein